VIIDKFEEQIKKYPNYLAIKTMNDKFTYQELNKCANAVAREILDRCDGEVKTFRERAALLFEHGSDMIIGKFGVLKAAKVYVPMNPTYPFGLLAYMLDNSEASFIITNDENEELANKLVEETESKAKVVNISKIKTIDGLENINPKCDGNEIAYILYTSGTTGRPKGVMQSHRNVLYFAECYKNTINITPDDRVTLLSSFSHDGGIGDICVALLNGASLYPLDVKSGITMNGFVEWLKAEQISIWHSVPTLYRHFINSINISDDFPLLRFIIVGGESVLLHDIKAYQKGFPGAKFAIMYGQSESSINSIQIYTEESKMEEVILGEPLQGTEIVIVDENREEVLPLNIGEIVVISDHVALGYWKDEEKSKEVFRDIPEVGRTYWTGDLGKLLLDGNIEILGRKDFQVKIRGFRVEMSGVESRIVELNGVKEAVVMSWIDDSGEKSLCAYVVSEAKVSVSELRQSLSTTLPDYMIPSYFIQLEELPQTPNGKVDRKALPKPTGEVKTEYAAPRDETEEILVKIWGEVLNRERVGIYDNFFELGGHSLKATIVISRIYKELNAKISLKEIFKAPTIAGLSKCIISLDKNMYEMIQVTETKEYFEASYTQKRMWVINQLEPNSLMFNMSGCVTLYEKIDGIEIQKIFDKLVERHDAFRTRFEVREGIVVQIIEKNAKLIIDIVDLVSLTIEERKKERTKIFGDLEAKIFDLREGNLVAVKLIKITDKEYDLVFCLHHIISDGWSMDVLKKEFLMLYEACIHQKEFELSPLRIQYKDFAEWQNRLIESNKFSADAKSFWADQLEGEIPILRLPIDYSANDTTDKTGNTYKTVLVNNIKDKLKELAIQSQTSLFIVLITTLISFLSELTEQDDILIGMPTLGRDHEDLHNVIGCFVNTTILRNKVNHDESFIELLQNIEKNTLDALEYQNYPLELVASELGIKYPQISVFFNMLNFNESANDYIVDFDSEHIAKTRDVKFDMEWNITEYLNAIQIICVYNAGLFKPKTIEYIVNNYTDYVTKVSGNPNKLLKDNFVDDKRRTF